MLYVCSHVVAAVTVYASAERQTALSNVAPCTTHTWLTSGKLSTDAAFSRRTSPGSGSPLPLSTTLSRRSAGSSTAPGCPLMSKAAVSAAAVSGEGAKSANVHEPLSSLLPVVLPLVMGLVGRRHSCTTRATSSVSRCAHTHTSRLSRCCSPSRCSTCFTASRSPGRANSCGPVVVSLLRKSAARLRLPGIHLTSKRTSATLANCVLESDPRSTLAMNCKAWWSVKQSSVIGDDSA